MNSGAFASAQASEEYLEWRFTQYPLFREFTDLWGDHDGEVVLDYGCGPGNDLTGFALYTQARRVIGIDVSIKALTLARDRLALHHVDPARIELVHTADSSGAIPLADASVDFLQSQGVLMHTSQPGALLREFGRVMRPQARACVMVYNADSVWRHLYVAFDKMIDEGAFAGLGLDEAFARCTDGPACPISRSWPPAEFTALCSDAGLDAEYVGGYLSAHELERMDVSWGRAITDRRLASEHREFLRSLTFDRHGLPMRNGYHAGIGGVYWLKPLARDAQT